MFAKHLSFLLVIIAASAFCMHLVAQESSPENQPEILQDIEAMKQEVVELNRALFEFEEDLIYPSEVQFSVFVTIDPASRFTLDSLDISVNNQLISSAIYTDAERQALLQGGTQRIYIGTLEEGAHKLSASFNGQGSSEQYYRRNKVLNFEKKDNPLFILLTISEYKANGEPLIKVKQW